MLLICWKKSEAVANNENENELRFLVKFCDHQVHAQFARIAKKIERLSSALVFNGIFY